MQNRLGPAAVALMVLLVGGCVVASGGAGVEAGKSPAELVALAKEEYRAGRYAKAEMLTATALKAQPGDPAALLVQAAALDRQKRFARADEIYRQLYPRIGKSAAFNNNYGYSMMLRGNLTAARKYFLLAKAAAPENGTVSNNMDLLRSASGSLEQG